MINIQLRMLSTNRMNKYYQGEETNLKCNGTHCWVALKKILKSFNWLMLFITHQRPKFKEFKPCP